MPKSNFLSFVVLEILNCHVTHMRVLIGPQSSRAIRAGKFSHYFANDFGVILKLIYRPDISSELE